MYSMGGINWCQCWLTLTPSGTYLDGGAGGTCEVVARKAASSGYLEATSATKIFKFALRNLYVTVSNTKTDGTAGTPITLTSSGGSGTGAVTYAVTGTGCSVTGTALNGTAGALCSVIATKAAQGQYAAGSSDAKTFGFGVAQDTLVVSNTTTAGEAGATVTLTTSGGSGSGAVTYAVTGTGCSLSGNALTATTGVGCSVIATKAASTPYNAATSVAKTFVNCPNLGSWTTSASKQGMTVTINYTAPNASLGWSSFYAILKADTSQTYVQSTTSTSNPGTFSVNSVVGSSKYVLYGTTNGGCSYFTPPYTAP